MKRLHRISRYALVGLAVGAVAACATVDTPGASQARAEQPATGYGTAYGIGYHAGGPSHRGGFVMGRAADQRMAPVAGPHAPLMRADDD